VTKREKPSKVKATGDTKKQPVKVDEKVLEQNEPLEDEELEGVAGGASKIWEPPTD
jgi:hypothetical protein